MNLKVLTMFPVLNPGYLGIKFQRRFLGVFLSEKYRNGFAK